MHLYEVPRAGKNQWQKWKWWLLMGWKYVELLFKRVCSFSFAKKKGIMETDGGNGRTAIYKPEYHLKLKNWYDGKFYIICILLQQKLRRQKSSGKALCSGAKVNTGSLLFPSRQPSSAGDFNLHTCQGSYLGATGGRQHSTEQSASRAIHQLCISLAEPLPSCVRGREAELWTDLGHDREGRGGPELSFYKPVQEFAMHPK